MNQTKTEASPRWEYSRYRATLRKDGEFVGLLCTVTGDAVSDEYANELLRIMNSHDAIVEALEALYNCDHSTGRCFCRRGAFEALALAKEGK